jgi:D-amino peptidase
MLNLLVDRFPKDVKIVRGNTRPLGMMEGIQYGHFDGTIFIGYHASSVNTKGVRAHTFSGSNLSEVNINGVSASEGYFSAGISGEYGVPVIMVSGDDAATKEIRSTVGDMEVAVVKQSLSLESAITMTPKAAQDLIHEKAKVAVTRIKDFKAFKVKGPLTMQITTTAYRPAELLAYLPIIKRINARTIEYKAETFTELSKFIMFMFFYSLSLEP